MLRLTALLGFFALEAAAQTGITECQKCAQPGGDCSKAYKGGQGVHCGDVAGNSFCCPSPTTGAKCWACKNAFRCYTGSRPSPNICVSEGGTNGVAPRSGGLRHEDREGEGLITLMIMVISVVAIASAVSACIRNRRQMPLHVQQAMTGVNMTQMGQMPVQGKPGQPMPAVAGMPMGQAMPGQPMPGQPMVAGAYPAYPMHPGGAYPAQQGYSGGSVAMGAGMGFLGGMMVGDMLSHHGGCGGGGYGGDYGGGGMGGGDMGGDFSADM